MYVKKDLTNKYHKEANYSNTNTEELNNIDIGELDETSHNKLKIVDRKNFEVELKRINSNIIESEIKDTIERYRALSIKYLDKKFVKFNIIQADSNINKLISFSTMILFQTILPILHKETLPNIEEIATPKLFTSKA
ncbi:8094_t:CDS:2 [Racocetra persica]|uniref:8094_t:CDS:1 n=1 Tax=Racocetra persica TaxID=160502 RepID=A0ACA9N9I8_9GLOM|nr:8094_t:CDS:2 [Racocetra persica]